jgi:hypothetical protein
LHKVLKGAVTKGTIKDGITRIRAEHSAAKKEIAEQARTGALRNADLDPAALVSALERYFSERAYLPDGAALTLAYFAMNSWAFDIFDTTLAYAVNEFFLNGGTDAWVIGLQTSAYKPDPPPATFGSVTFTALEPPDANHPLTRPDEGLTYAALAETVIDRPGGRYAAIAWPAHSALRGPSRTWSSCRV